MEKLRATIAAPDTVSIETVLARIGNLSGVLHQRLESLSRIGTASTRGWSGESWGPELHELYQAGYLLMPRALLNVTLATQTKLENENDRAKFRSLHKDIRQALWTLQVYHEQRLPMDDVMRQSIVLALTKQQERQRRMDEEDKLHEKSA